MARKQEAIDRLFDLLVDSMIAKLEPDADGIYPDLKGADFAAIAKFLSTQMVTGDTQDPGVSKLQRLMEEAQTSTQSADAYDGDYSHH